MSTLAKTMITSNNMPCNHHTLATNNPLSITVAAYHNEGIERMAIITPDKDHSHVATYHLNSFILNNLKERKYHLSGK